MRSNWWIGWTLGFLLAVVVPAGRPAWGDTVAHLETTWDDGASAYRWDYSITSTEQAEAGDWWEIGDLYDVSSAGVDLGGPGQNAKWSVTYGEDWACWTFVSPGKLDPGTYSDFYYYSSLAGDQGHLAPWEGHEGDHGQVYGAGGTHVPEPTTVLLFGIGSLGLAALARRRRSAQEGA
jgi:hypothetical protein